MKTTQTVARALAAMAVLGQPCLAFAQTQPAAQTLPFTFTDQTGGALPAGIAVHAFAALPQERLLTPGVADLAYNSAANSGGWRDQGADGIGLLGSSNANGRSGAVVAAVNTTGRTNIQVSWTARTVLQQATRDNSIALQYRVGTSGDFADVAGTEYTSQGNAVGHSTTFTNITLPPAANNQAVVQVRWIYWESNPVSGSRDRIAVDDITISGTAGGGDTTPPTVTGVSVSGNQSVDVTFSEALGTGATTAANYAISGTGRGTLATNPSSVALQSGTTYRLSWASGEMLIGGNITITATNLQDTAGNAIAGGNAGTHTAGATGVAPSVGAAFDNPTSRTLEVTFSEPMGTGVTTPANYTLSNITPGSVTPNPDSVVLLSGTTYRLVWNDGHFGDDIAILTIAGVSDLAGNAINAINNTASGLVPVELSSVEID